VLWSVLTTAAADRPDDVDALKAMIIALTEKAVAADAEVAELETLKARADERIERVTSIIEMLERARYGKRSEKLKPDLINAEQQGFCLRRDRDEPCHNQGRTRHARTVPSL
jgi:hypothetical protein